MEVFRMFEKLFKVVILIVLVLSFSTINVVGVDAATVMWGKTELKLGQIGKVTILSPTELVKIESDGSLSTVRAIKKGEEYRVYSFKSNDGGLYGVGGGSFVQKNAKVKYETPSKSKIALLQQQGQAAPNDLSTQINTTESVNSLENVLTTANWDVQNDFDGNSGRFFAYKEVNPITQIYTGVVAVRSNKIGGSFIDIIAQNTNDTDVLDASRKLLNLFGASVTAKQFTSIVNTAKESSTYQTVNLGEHTFYVIYSDGNLHFSETEGETHFN